MVNEGDKTDNEAGGDADTLRLQNQSEIGLLILFVCRKGSLWG